MTTARVELPAKLIPVFTGDADVRGAYGGRGSAKTRSFAKMSAVFGYRCSAAGMRGIILCARQFMNSLDESSLEEIKEAIRSESWLLEYYEIGEKYVRTKCGRVSYKFAGLDRNVDSVKSKARILLCWVDEAEPVTDDAWTKLIPTIREEGSELWVTWNPERENSSTHKRFRETKDDRYKVAELNWRDNPKFPIKLDRERQRDLRDNPDQYDHIWEGGFKQAVRGAYYAKCLAEARAAGRIGRVSADPLMTIRAFCDIGGTGAKADAFTMWIAQFVGREIRALDYYEAVGQDFATHVAWLRQRGYTKDRAQIWLPHDGKTQDRVINVSYESAFQDVGYSVTVIPNQGRGAASARIEAGRRLFPSIWFNCPPGAEDDKEGKIPTCAGGVSAIGWYHEKIDEKRGIGLGPDHDWSSHGADSFGLMCLCYEPPRASDSGQGKVITDYNPF